MNVSRSTALLLSLGLLSCGGAAAADESDSGGSGSGGAASTTGTSDGTGDSETTGPVSSCGDAAVDPGEHCDSTMGCPSNCVFPLGSELWNTVLGPSSTYLFGQASGRVGRGIAQTQSAVVVGYLGDDETLALEALDAASGEPRWGARIENVGEPQCMDCDLAFVTRVVATPAGVCTVGQTITYDPNSTPEGVIACFDPVGGLLSETRFAVAEYGASTLVAAALAPAGGVRAFGRTLLPEEGDFLVTIDSDLQLEDIAASMVDQHDYAMLVGDVFGVDIDRVSSVDGSGTPQSIAAFEGEQLGLIASTAAGRVAVAGVRELSAPREPVNRYALVWHVLEPDGTVLDEGNGDEDGEVDFVSDLAWGPTGALFVLVRRSADARTALVQLENGASSVVWTTDAESIPGAIDTTESGFVSIAVDTGMDTTLVTAVTRVAVDPGP